jgi:DNA invertase Pin-like site-specific DNA recombinase
MTTTAFSYLRVSSHGQISGDGFTRQRSAINDFAKNKKFTITEEFRDEGVSGTKEGFDRDGLSDLMFSAKTNGVNIIIVESASRLARDLMVQEVILSDCRKYGVTVYDASGTDLTVSDNDPTRKMIRQVLGAVSEFEKSSLVQKLAASRKRIRNSGRKCEGRKSYVELEHPAVEVIKEMRGKRRAISFQKIADHLNNEKGITTIKGTQWKYQQVQQVWQTIQAA